MQAAEALSDAEIAAFLEGCQGRRGLVLGVSGGPDSFGMLAAFARWREAPPLVVAAVDHGLRPESAQECERVMAAAARFGLSAATLRWEGPKPATGLQEAAREARFRLLSDHARAVGAEAVVLAHHQEDQAETVLMRLIRGSGPLGLKAMAETSERGGMTILRPFLWLPKARLRATAEAAGLAPVNDPSNEDERFTRVRLRRLMPLLAAEGLDIERLALLAGRMRMVDAAIAQHVAELDQASRRPSIAPGTVVLDAAGWLEKPLVDIQQLLAAVMAEVVPDGPRSRLEALEELSAAVLMALSAGEAYRQTLQGALVSVTASGRVIVAREPARRAASTP